ncbi:hypothetical protein [Haliea sp. E17]|uniref:hypothetical protein n=1 Tax=Haliea sp. E17 TaxID=3401576 RepID=UPI003AAE950C
MASALLDINDCTLSLWTEHGRVESPGYALLQGRDYRFGETARASARLTPRNINNRYWWQLGTAPLQPALGPARHTADLVHAHLLQLHAEAGAPGSLAIACPGSMSREQLSLLLGITQQCPFTVTALVDRSTLIGSLQPGAYHLELQLHQALLTELVRTDGSVAAGSFTPLPGCGLLQLQERLVAQIADAFIRQTRFDPRRQAHSEQALYDALPTVLAALAGQGEYNFELGGHRARLSRSELAAASARLVSAIRETIGERSASLLLDPLPGALPGLPEAFPGCNTPPPDSAWRAALELADHLHSDSGQFNLHDSLPDRAPAATTSAARAAATSPARPQPTHLLQGAVARPLGEEPVVLADGVVLQRQAQGWTVSGEAEVNRGAATPGQPLRSGDLIRVAGEEYRLIEVLARGS